MSWFPASTARCDSCWGDIPVVEARDFVKGTRRRRVSARTWVLRKGRFSMSSGLLGNRREPVSRERRELMLLDGDPRRRLLDLSGLSAEKILENLDAALRAF